MKIENCLLFRKVYFIEQIEMLLDQRYTDPHPTQWAGLHFQVLHTNHLLSAKNNNRKNGSGRLIPGVCQLLLKAKLSFISIHYRQLTMIFHEVDFIGQIGMMLDQRYTDPRGLSIVAEGQIVLHFNSL